MPSTGTTKKYWNEPKKDESWSGDGFYQTPRWIRYSKQYRKEHPLCEECKKKGKIVPSKVVDHVVPISEGGDEWSPGNHRALCIKCHNRKSGKESANKR